ncbi:MAG: DUF4433 domain-containing protein [Bacteroidia bacterium]
MTHIENIPHILQYGITSKDSVNVNPSFVPIGDQSLIDVRSTKPVYISNGGAYPLKTIVLGDFIPFYFGIRMPMLYVVQNGGNFVKSPTKAENVIYLVCGLSSILQQAPEYYFSDGHATDNFTSFFDATRINDLPNIVDWKAVQAPYWAGNENLDLKRKKQAEFLVSTDINPQYLKGFICYNEPAANQLISYGIDVSRIKILPNCYY